MRAFERGLAVIRTFGKETPELTLTEVARATNLTRAAARRFLLTLVELGYVQTDGRVFSLRPRVLELGYAYLSALSLPEVAQGHMERLVHQVRETCSLAVLDEDEVVYVARVHTRRIVTLSINVGTRFPAYATSMGRVLLAYQDREWLERYLSTVAMAPSTSRSVTDPRQLASVLATVRAQGYCVTEQELEEGLRSVAVPIRGGSGSVIAAMNVSAHTSGRDADSFRSEVLPVLLEVAAAVHEDLVTR
ncbi:IclR family transcriptional regulator domain-containing protein [Blastococcus aggregatus]|uniref:IclR family transcriptional regulator domain-containing protein n=1 Tax=Blastococcus aggregatus TaxID=38502 RepID=UPI001C3E9F3B|nr:IclR family transcriptional regulator C-terminal domain-containing protein [Blastococcus aggregatus]